ncbi:MAG: HAMP domain-containing histidine kinase [Ruminococcus sp.]|nr:HAMP domain-containing histidine kinase [Ruminococcus sp.]
MLKKLSFRFSAAAIGSLFFIELVMILFINGMNYFTTLNQTDETLSLIVENGGRLPDMKDFFFDSQLPASRDPRFSDNRADREFRYTMRYFSAVTDGRGTIYAVNTGNIVTVSQDMAILFSEDVFSREDFRGFYNGMDFRCQVKTYSDGSRLAVFCDFSTAAQNFQSVFKISATISLGLLAVFSVLIVLLSKRVVKPVIENQEKQARFITDAGHELKTPLAIIRANTEVIEMTSGESEWTRSTINQTDRLNDLLQRMLMLAKSSESSSFSFAELDLTALARKLADDFETYCTAENKPLEADIAEGMTVNGDAKMLDMLLSTLLENAVKYGKAESPIGLSLKESGKHLTLAVTNLCSDPPQGDTRLLFDRFYRGDSSRTRETGGSGIGLSIAKMITEAHKGKIACEVEGERVTFMVRLPKEHKKQETSHIAK